MRWLLDPLLWDSVGLWLSSHLPPSLGLPGWKEGSPVEVGQWQEGAGYTLLSEQKERRETRQAPPWTAPLPPPSPAMGTEPGSSKECWETLRKAPCPGFENCWQGIHTLSGRKSSTEAHAHTLMQTPFRPLTKSNSQRGASLVAQLVKNLPAMEESWVGKICWRGDRLPTPVFLGILGGSDGEESNCNVGDLGSIPGLGRSPAGGRGNTLQYSCLENPHGQRSLAGYNP